MQDIFAKLIFIGGENPDTQSPPGNRHIPLPGIGGCLDGGIREQDLIDSLPLRTVGSDSIAAIKLPVTSPQRASILQMNSTIGFNPVNGDNLAIGHTLTAFGPSICF